MNNAIVLLARLFLAHIFLLAGFGKITGYAGTQGYMESMGVPGALLPLVIVLEVGGGLALIFGFLTRWAALALAVFCVAAAVIFHRNFDEQMQMILFMKNFAMAGGFLLLYVQGPGAFSIDAWRGK
ncbi:DoxX family protein [Pseudomonas borbori]|jgi:putative oxidoreductase|uniref:Putative oxidoreductase n=1 Tax=Pseudomonas borbori TaxID=289003 RepID=A0A1I5L5X7_9PSED|nr:DoxX family protein [Pseudomonas borbori]SFO92266.1 putative oxidoreductase [Pseudomonas borbori]